MGLQRELIWYRRGSGANPTWTRVVTDPVGYGDRSSGTSPGVGNWDGDGDDLVIGDHWGILRLFRNDGPPSWAEQPFSFPFDLAGDSAPALADRDADGDLDLLVGQVHGEVHQYTNVSAGTAPSWRFDGLLLTLPWTHQPHPFPTFADIDSDDDFDLFVGEGGWQGDGAGGDLHHCLNVGSPITPCWTLVTTSFLGLDVGG